MKGESAKALFRKVAATAAITAALFLILSSCACVEHETRVDFEFGKINQGERIRWSVSYDESPPLNPPKDGQPLLGEKPVDPCIYYLSVCAEDDVWAASLFGVVYHFDGSSWSRVASLDNILVRSLYAADRNHVWVGGEEAIDGEGMEKGVIFFFNGESWVRQLEAVGGWVGISGFNLMDGSGSRNVWAVNSSSSIYHYDGLDWKCVNEEMENGGLIWTDDKIYVTQLIVGDEGMPIICINNERYFSYGIKGWQALPDIKIDNGYFRCIWLMGCTSGGFLVSGMVGDKETIERANIFTRNGIKWAIYRYHDRQWKREFERCEESLTKCVQVKDDSMLAVSIIEIVNKFDIKYSVSRMLYYDGSSWSEQGSIEYAMVWDIESVGGDTIWLVDGERIIKGEILD